MAKEKICGIYCIENLVNGKRYIGQSKNIYHRWDYHKSNLNNNRHYNGYLQKSWNKYGADNFKFYILEKCILKELNEKEKSWISYYNTKEAGYNLTYGGDGCIGRTCLEITKNKISKANKGRVYTSEQRQRIKDSLKDNPNVLKGARHPFFNKKLSKEEILKLKNGIKKYYETNNHTPPWSKSVICVTTGEIFSTIKKGAQKYNITSSIRECCNHNREFAGELPDGTRLQWEWYEEGKEYIKKPQIRRSNAERPILQYDLDNNFIQEWPSAKICSDNTGLQRSKICCVCKGQRRQTGGYIFRYKETA
jgi:group I intron endonuclease